MKIRYAAIVLSILILLALAGLCSADSIHPDLASALQSANSAGKLLIVDFYGAWCPWCVKMDETMSDASVKTLLDQKYYYYKLDVGRFDQHTDCIKQYKVDGIPCLIVFDSTGTEKARCGGYEDVPTFTTFLSKTAGVAPPPAPINADLKDALQTANQAGKLLLVDFYGAWCPWCVKMDETLADASVKDALDARFYYYKLDVGRFDKHTECLKQYEVDGIPHITVFYPDGSVKATCGGYEDATKFKAFLADAGKRGFTPFTLETDKSDPILSAVQKAAASGLRLVVFFYDSSDSDSVALDKSLEDANTAGVAEHFAVLKIEQSSHKGLASQYGCTKAPFLIIFKDEGSVSTFFTEPVTTEKLKEAMSKSLSTPSTK